MLQHRMSQATIVDLIEGNRLLSMTKDFSQMQVAYRSIPLESGVFLLATDASWAICKGLKSQAGHMIMFADSSLAHES